MTRNYLLLFLTCTLLTTACNTPRKTTGKTEKGMTARSVLQQMAAQELNPEWFSSRIRVAYDDGEQSVSGSATLRMQKDELVWMSIKKFGLELARVKVTPDSVYVLDRINREYTIESLDYLASSYGLPANLSGLQDFLLGNAVLLDGQKHELQNLGPTYQLSAPTPNPASTYWVDAAGFFLRKMAFVDAENDQQVEVMLDGFAPAGDQANFPYLRNLSINGRSLGQMEIGLEFSKIEVDVPQSISFDIPSKYTRAR